MRRVQIGSRIISYDKFEKPYIIAEIGVNHENDIRRACEMVKLAKDSGADAVKFQFYKSEKLAAKHSPAYWDLNMEPTRTQRELFSKYDKFSAEDYIKIAEYTKEQGVDFLCTPFDEQVVDFLYELVPAYKVASADITNFPLLKKIAQKGKPILLSTGASTISEIWKAIEVIKCFGNDQIVILHCVLNYPTSYKDANLGRIQKLLQVFPDYVIGYSDHTLPEMLSDVLITAWLLGARVIEKHFTFDKSLKGNDHYHSMDAKDLKMLVEKMSKILDLYGDGEDNISLQDLARENARRRIVASQKITRGEVFSENNITLKRANKGLHASYYYDIIGKRARRDIEKDEIIDFDSVE